MPSHSRRGTPLTTTTTGRVPFAAPDSPQESDVRHRVLLGRPRRPRVQGAPRPPSIRGAGLPGPRLLPASIRGAGLAAPRLTLGGSGAADPPQALAPEPRWTKTPRRRDLTAVVEVRRRPPPRSIRGAGLTALPSIPPRDSWPPRLPFAARDWQRLTPQRLPFAGRDSARRSPEPRRVAEHHPVPARAPRQLRRPRPLRRHHLRRPLHLAPGAPRSIRARDSTPPPLAARDSPGPRLTTTTIDAPASICGAGLQGVAYCAWGGVGCVRLGPFPARDSPPRSIRGAGLPRPPTPRSIRGAGLD